MSEQEQTPRETLENWLVSLRSGLYVAPSEVREAIRAVLAGEREVEECRKVMLGFHAAHPGLSLVENLSNLIANLNALADERRIAEAERDEYKREVERLTPIQELAQKYQAERDFLRQSMQRVAEAAGIEDPMQLIAKAENNEETYTDILVKHIKAERDALRATVRDLSIQVEEGGKEERALRSEVTRLSACGEHHPELVACFCAACWQNRAAEAYARELDLEAERDALQARVEEMTPQYEEVAALRAEVERPRAHDESNLAFVAGLKSVLMIRCPKHFHVPQYNREESSGAECAACEVDAQDIKLGRFVQMMQRIAEDVLSDPVRYSDLTPEMVRDAFVQSWNTIQRDFTAFRATAQETSNHLHDVIRERDALRAEVERLTVLHGLAQGAEIRNGVRANKAEAALADERAIKVRLVNESGHRQQALAEIERRLNSTQYYDLVRAVLRDTAPAEEPDTICPHGGLLGNYPDCCMPAPAEEPKP